MKKVLFVGGNTEDLELLMQFLPAVGCTLSGHVERGSDAVRMVSETQPDLILVNLSLSGSWNGIETAKEIHHSSKIPMLFLVEQEEEERIEESLRLKPVGFLHKPLSRARIRAVMSNALQRIEREKKLTDLNLQLEESACKANEKVLEAELGSIAKSDFLARMS
ncbi:MAG: response regulator, partial [Planctomycetota bacterium]